MAFIPLIICVVGLIMYFVATQPKVQEVGRIMFWTALLSILFGLPHFPAH